MQFKPAESVLASAAKGILAADLSISGTSFTLQAGQGAAFPASDFSVEINGETIDVGTRTNDTFSSLTRANPVPHNGGARGEPVYHVTSGAAIADAVTAGPGGSQPFTRYGPYRVVAADLANPNDKKTLCTVGAPGAPAVGDVVMSWWVGDTTAVGFTVSGSPNGDIIIGQPAALTQDLWGFIWNGAPFSDSAAAAGASARIVGGVTNVLGAISEVTLTSGVIEVQGDSVFDGGLMDVYLLCYRPS
jgi:hypothetical protein